MASTDFRVKNGLTVDGNITVGTGNSTATPVGTIIQAPAGFGTDITGGNLTITAGNGTGTGGSGSIIFQTAPSAGSSSSANTLASIVYIDKNGYVGIGTTPSARLHISGASGVASRAYIDATASTGIPIFILNKTNTTNNTSDFQGSIYWQRTLTDSTIINSSIFSFGSNNSTSPAMNIVYNAYTSHSYQISGTERMRLDSNGNLGIGTNTPSYKMDLIGSNRSYGILSTPLATPGTPAGTPGSGGSLAAATYYFKIVAVDGLGGVSLPGTESTGVTATLNQKIDLIWTAVTGAASYQIWYTRTSGTYTGANTGYYTSTTNSYSFAASSGTTGTIPISNTTGSLKLNGSTSGTITLLPTATSGTNTITFPATTGTVITTGDNGTVTNTMLANSSFYIGTTSISLGRTTANQALTGISSVSFPGSTSGTAILQATAIAGTPTLSLPTLTGTLVGTGDTGSVTNTMLANSSITINSAITALGNSVIIYAGTTALQTSAAGQSLSGITSIDGGSSVSQSLTLKSTSGVGTTDSILFKVGNNGATTAMTISTTGLVTTGNDLTVTGNLIVNGVTTSVNSSTVTVDDKNIELASVASGVISTTGTVGSITGSGPWTATITSMTTTTGLIVGSSISAGGGTGSLYGGSPITVVVASIVSSTSITYTVTGASATAPVAGTVTNITTTGATNVTADGAGITVKGVTDKTWNWVNSTSSWTSSENIDLATGKAYYIAGSSVLTATEYVGNSATATKLKTARSINGVLFDGTADITTGSGTATKATNLVGGNNTTQLGSIPYQSNTDTTTLLAPNTTTTKKFLRMTGDGTNGAAPAWDTIVAVDIPTLNQNTTGSAGKATNLVGGNNTTGLGSIPYQSNTDVTSLLSPNTTVNRKFLTQTGNGTNGAAPVWSQTYTTSSGAPGSPVVGDLWYKSTSDIFYVYVNDGTSSFWLSLNTYPSSFSNLAVTTALTVSGTVSSNLTPTTTNLYTLGTASLLWSNVYATTFTGALSGNATTATTATTASYVTNGNPNNGDNYMNFRVMRNTNTSVANDGMFIGYGNSNSGITRIYGGGGTTNCISFDNINFSPSADNTLNLGSSTSNRFATVYAVTFNGTATKAQYADLAECYASDAEYEPGTVLDFGGANEVTISTKDMSRKIAGVVSTNPGYLMNAGLESEFVITLALAGRVPCKVQGTVRKGDMMVSAGNGYARAEEDPKLGSVIGKALEDFDGETGIIEVVVGRL